MGPFIAMYHICSFGGLDKFIMYTWRIGYLNQGHWGV